MATTGNHPTGQRTADTDHATGVFRSTSDTQNSSGRGSERACECSTLRTHPTLELKLSAFYSTGSNPADDIQLIRYLVQILQHWNGFGKIKVKKDAPAAEVIAMIAQFLNHSLDKRQDWYLIHDKWDQTRPLRLYIGESFGLDFKSNTTRIFIDFLPHVNTTDPDLYQLLIHMIDTCECKLGMEGLRTFFYNSDHSHWPIMEYMVESACERFSEDGGQADDDTNDYLAIEASICRYMKGGQARMLQEDIDRCSRKHGLPKILAEMKGFDPFSFTGRAFDLSLQLLSLTTEGNCRTLFEHFEDGEWFHGVHEAHGYELDMEPIELGNWIRFEWNDDDRAHGFLCNHLEEMCNAGSEELLPHHMQKLTAKQPFYTGIPEFYQQWMDFHNDFTRLMNDIRNSGPIKILLNKNTLDYENQRKSLRKDFSKRSNSCF